VSVGPHIAARTGQALETEPRLVDGAVGTSVDQEIVDEGTEQAAEERSNHRDPEVISSSRPNLVTVSKHVRNKTRTKVTGKVDSVTSLPTEAGTDAKDQEEQTKGHELSGANVVVIGHGVNAHHQDGRGNDFGEEHASAGHERSGVCAEDASGGSVASDSPDASTTLKHVDGGLVVAVDDSSASHGSENLSEHVDRELAPRVATENTVGKGDGRIDVTTALAGGVNTKHDTDSPAPRDGLVISLLASTKNDLGDDTVTEEDQDHGTEELREGILHRLADAHPLRRVGSIRSVVSGRRLLVHNVAALSDLVPLVLLVDLLGD
jgi:hypothetical protein